ncbi:hypothetical protein [Caldilinea sp.]|uniref:hypothetical protein n=1 Tax=Caldilinea sp. TaxID=2293560 RepID=UPI0021DC276D|nr:hypothetical protein [Caldilinea sp.]GIV67318.1 MAG: hypothetical protein KatS3mg048_0180 [Caldilinea sp.]
MRSKLISLLLVMALLLASFSTAFAQAEPFCGDLSADDCELLTVAMQNMLGVTSYQASAEYRGVLAGLPGLGIDEAAVTVTVDGSFSYGEEAVAAAAALAGVQTQEDLAAVMAESPEVLVDFYNGWSFDMVIVVDISEELAEALSADIGVPVPDLFSVPVKLVDGVLYVNLTDVAPLLEGGESLAGWLGFEFGPVLEAAAEQGMFEAAATQMEMDPSMLADSPENAALAAVLFAVQSSLSDPTAFEQYMAVSRAEDDVINDMDVAVFVTKMDIPALISSPEFIDLIKGLAESGSLGEGAPSAAEIEQALTMLSFMGPMLFQGLVSESTTAVSLEEPNYIVAQTTLFSWDLSGLLQMAAMTGALPAEEMPSGASLVEFSTSVVNSAFNEPQTINAPADATIIPAESMMAAP